MEPSRILVFSENIDLFQELVPLLPAGYTAMQFDSLPDLQKALREEGNALLIVTPPAGNAQPVLQAVCQHTEDLPLLVIMRSQPTVAAVNALLEVRPQALIAYPFQDEEVRSTLAKALQHKQRVAEHRHLKQDLAKVNERLNQRLQEINTIYTVGKSVAATLDVNEVLERIVDASVNLTQADEGFILLKEADKLYLRIAKSMSTNVARRLNVEASDHVAWQVIRSGRPTMLRRNTRVAAGYVARSLLYVPLHAPGSGNLGVLSVVNCKKDQGFTENHLLTLSSIADFAAIALENAHLFSDVEAERSRLSTILEHAAEAILVTDDQNRLWLWSGTAASVFGIPPEAQGHPIEHAINHAAIREIFAEATNSGPILHTEVYLEDGRVFNAQLSTIHHIGRVLIMQNITHLKELDRLKSEFVSMVSHDLRTPLTTVQGYIELLDRVGPLTEMQQTFIHKALTSLTHITALIGDLLDIGRIEAGYDLEMRALQMDAIVRQTADAYTMQAEAQGIQLKIDLPPQPLWVWGNARRLRQVLENLVSNAMKYNRPGGQVMVRALQDNEYVIVRVEDSGIGIPVEEQPHLFQRFYRVQSPETEDIRGTGLGLAIVKSVIEKHKGRVWVESTPGKGSVFAFVLSVYNESNGEIKPGAQIRER